jgi:hypothetical protein
MALRTMQQVETRNRLNSSAIQANNSDEKDAKPEEPESDPLMLSNQSKKKDDSEESLFRSRRKVRTTLAEKLAGSEKFQVIISKQI